MEGLKIRIDAREGRWCLVLWDSDEATYALFDELGLQGGGYTWEAVALGLLELRAPQLSSLLEVNAEGDEMYAYAATRPPLEAFEALLRAGAADHSLLRAAMERAGDRLE